MYKGMSSSVMTLLIELPTKNMPVDLANARNVEPPLFFTAIYSASAFFKNPMLLSRIWESFSDACRKSIARSNIAMSL